MSLIRKATEEDNFILHIDVANKVCVLATCVDTRLNKTKFRKKPFTPFTYEDLVIYLMNHNDVGISNPAKLNKLQRDLADGKILIKQ